MRLIQFMHADNSSRRLGLVAGDGERIVDITAQKPEISSLFALYRFLLDREMSAQSWIDKNISQGDEILYSYSSLVRRKKNPGGPQLLLPIDQPYNPWAFQLWGAGVTHKRSADAREEEAVQVSGARVSFYDKIYLEGEKGGFPKKGAVGAKPEIFFKAHGHHVVPHNACLEKAPNSLRLSPEPEVVAFFMADPLGVPTLIGFSAGNDFSDQGWESENPLYLTHAKVQDGMASLGPVFVTLDTPGFNIAEIQLRCQVHRGGKVVMDSGFLCTGEKHMAHSLQNLAWHLFNHRKIQDDEVRGLYMGTSAVFSLPLEENDEIVINYNSGLGDLANKLIAPAVPDPLPAV